MTPVKRGQLEACIESLVDSALCTFFLANFNPYPFAIINGNREFNSFAVFC